MNKVPRKFSLTARARERHAPISRLLAATAVLAAAVVLVNPTVGSAAGATTDTCGYLSTQVPAFNESTVIRGAQVNGTYPNTTISLWGNDETGLLLGVNSATPNTSSPQQISGAGVSLGSGAPSAYDATGRPQYPALWFTDITGGASTAGDWQNTTVTNTFTANTVNGSAIITVTGGGPVSASDVGSDAFDTNTSFPQGSVVIAVSGSQVTLSQKATKNFTNDNITLKKHPDPANLTGTTPFADFVAGTWATGTQTNPGVNYVGTHPTVKNNYNEGASPPATPVPASVIATGNEGYSAEVRWNVSDFSQLLAGHTYRVQVINHDGDQNKTGGDVGEFCTTLSIPGPPGLTTDVTGGTNPANTHAHITVPAGTNTSDTIYLAGTAGNGNVTGSATAHLFFVPNGTVLGQVTDACTSQYEVNAQSSPADAQFPDTEQLTVGSPSYATSKSHAVGTALGTYYWQWVYPGAGNYTGITENCGEETAAVAKPRIRLAPYNAANVISFPHTVTATLDYTTDGSAYSPVAGASVSWTLTNPSAPPATSATFVANHGSPCTTDNNGQCSVIITDSVAETVNINASASGFTSAPAVTGTFGSVSTSSHGTCSGAADSATTTCDSTKTYVKPSTTMSIIDHLVGLPNTSSGTVSYTKYANHADCVAGQNGTANGGGAVTPGNPPTVAPSNSSDVAQGSEQWFTATFSDGTTSYTTDCIESVVNHT